VGWGGGGGGVVWGGGGGGGGGGLGGGGGGGGGSCPFSAERARQQAGEETSARAPPRGAPRGGGGGQRARSSSRCVCAARVVPARANERNIGVLVHDPMDAGGEPTAQTGGAGGPGAARVGPAPSSSCQPTPSPLSPRRETRGRRGRVIASIARSRPGRDETEVIVRLALRFLLCSPMGSTPWRGEGNF